MNDWIIREEQPGDLIAIRQVTEAAFAGHPHSEGTEAAIIDGLRACGDLALSLVAEAGSQIVGHVAFSPALLTTGEQGWYVLGPISVLPQRQGQGIGRGLVEAGVEHWRSAGAKGIVVLGDPGLYGRFGFTAGTGIHIPGPLADYLQVLPFAADVPHSAIAFAPAFSSPGNQDR